jgi:hypothetical protein
MSESTVAIASSNPSRRARSSHVARERPFAPSTLSSHTHVSGLFGGGPGKPDVPIRVRVRPSRTDAHQRACYGCPRSGTSTTVERLRAPRFWGAVLGQPSDIDARPEPLAMCAAAVSSVDSVWHGGHWTASGRVWRPRLGPCVCTAVRERELCGHPARCLL